MTWFTAPALDFDSLPPDQLEAAVAIGHNLASLEHCVKDLGLSLDLFEHLKAMPNGMQLSQPGGPGATEISRQMERRAAWLRIAAGNGALVLYGFWKLVEAIDSLLREARALKARVDMPAKKHAKGLFRKAFPHLAEIRKVAAHPHELSSTPAEQKKHRETQTGLFIGAGLSINHEHTYFYGTFKGRFVGYDVSARGRDNLEMVCRAMWAAFYPAENPIRAEARAVLANVSTAYAKLAAVDLCGAH